MLATLTGGLYLSENAGPVAQLGRGGGLKIRLVWVQIPPGLHEKKMY
jgi:hypothetical protein